MVGTAALHAAIGEIYGSVFNVPFAAFRLHAMERVRALIPFDSAVWAAGIHDENQILDFELIDQQPDMIMRYALAFADADMVRASAIANPGQAFRIEDVMGLEAYRALPIYRDFGAKIGIEHALGSAAVDPVTRLEELIVLWRAERDQPFSAAERDTHALLVPHLLNAWRHRQAIHLYEQAMAGPTSQHLQQRYVAIVNGLGLVLAADPGFATLIAERFEGWAGPQLPLEIMEKMQGEQQAFAIRDVDFTLTPGENRGVIAASRTAKARELTEAEWRVIRLFLDSKTATEIADMLGVSASTVRNQIASSYSKLGVNSKFALARKLQSAEVRA